MKTLNNIIKAPNGEQKTNTRAFAICVLVVATLSVSACGRNKIVNTVDDSAEYKSAKALPPLQKPRSIDPKPVIASQPAVTESVVSTQTAATEDQKVVAAPVTSSESKPASSADSEIVIANNKAKLIINSDLDSAWGLLTNSLTNSELTVFSRNKTAGRIAIGCAEIGNDTQSSVKRAGGWSIFSRKKQRTSEYCALQTQERKGQTLVRVLDRTGEEVTAEYGRVILARVFNN